ncbi:MAG: hypothetical protein ACLQVY_01770 [Limisphaerales bacterium]
MKGAIVNCIKAGFAAALVLLLPGCVGYVDGDGDGGVVAVDPVPGPYFYGDFYARGRDVHAFHDRGFRSHGFAHGGGHRR